MALVQHRDARRIHRYISMLEAFDAQRAEEIFCETLERAIRGRLDRESVDELIAQCIDAANARGADAEIVEETLRTMAAAR